MHGCKFSLGILPVLLLAAFASAEPGRRQKKSTTIAAPVKVVYSVADLIVPIEEYPIPRCADFDIDQREPLPAIPHGANLPGTMHTNKKRTFEDQLIRLIESTVAPNSWNDAGGLGTIEYDPVKMSLVVTQSVAVQEQIGELLAELRRLQDVEVPVTLHILKVSDESLNEFPVGREQLMAGKTHLLESAQIKQVLTAAESQRRNEIMQSPRITVFNGQLAFINVQDQLCCLDDVQVEKRDGKFVILPKYQVFPIGMSCTVRPLASADHKTVDLSMKFRLATLDSNKRESTPLIMAPEASISGPDHTPWGEEIPPPPEQEIPLKCTNKKPNVSLLKLDCLLEAIPVGQTALMYVGTATEEFREENALTDIPFLSQYFKTVEEGRHTRHVLLMLTANIIVQPAEGEFSHYAPFRLAAPDILALKTEQWVPRSRAFRKGVDGDYVVRADGCINLGKLGCVHVAGLSLPQAKAAIEKHLTKYSLCPKIDLAVGGNNDKRVRVTYEKDGEAQQVFDLLWNDRMTVEDALDKCCPSLGEDETTAEVLLVRDINGCKLSCSKAELGARQVRVMSPSNIRSDPHKVHVHPGTQIHVLIDSPRPAATTLPRGWPRLGLYFLPGVGMFEPWADLLFPPDPFALTGSGDVRHISREPFGPSIISMPTNSPANRATARDLMRTACPEGYIVICEEAVVVGQVTQADGAVRDMTEWQIWYMALAPFRTCAGRAFIPSESTAPGVPVSAPRIVMPEEELIFRGELPPMPRP